MKKLFTILFSISILAHSLWAQSPEAFKYQSVIRDAAGQVIQNQKVSLRLSILQNTATGTSVYVETQTPTTNEFGLISLEIGKGTLVSGSFSTIAWGTNTYFLQTELDLAGGSAFVLLGSSQLLSVPYALYAKTAGNGFSGNYNDLSNKPNKVSTFTNDALYLKTETDPIFAGSLAKNIKASDTLRWGKNSSGDYNDLTNKPTKVSSFTNDAGYIRTETDPIFAGSLAKNIKASDTLRWGKNSSGDYNDLTNKPTKVSTFTNDAGYIRTETDPIFAGSLAKNIKASDTLRWGKNSSGDYNDLTNKPTKVSSFTNDAGYLKTETDPIFAGSLAKNIKASDTLRWGKNSSGDYNDLTNKPNKVSTFTNDAGYLKTETDPIFESSLAKNIKASDTLRWGKKLPVGTAGNLLTYDGTNWIAKDLVLSSGVTGGSQSFSILPPYLCVNYCIALYGIFPARNGSDHYIAEIMTFGGNFPPQGYAFCDGQLMSIAQNTALFSLLGTMYGGDGRTTFALPDLRGRFPMHTGGTTGPGLSGHDQGEKSGSETQTLTISQMPMHNHVIIKQ